jgi:outer membrane biosynthesis protein TonB
MLALTGVASIYAYDARLENNVYEQVITMLPPEAAPAKPITPTGPRPTSKNDKASDIAERTVAMFDVDRPEIVPETISANPNTVPPLPTGNYKISDRNYTPPVAITTGPVTEGVAPQPKRVEIPDELPLPTPPQPPAKKIVVSKKVLNSEAVSLPRPMYPPLARQIRLQGQVVVQVLIDERGKVISAQPAALQARFTPTLIGDDPVKVSGVIIYNFVMQ